MSFDHFRLYSDYYFLGYGNSPERFHKDAIRAVAMIENCQKTRTTKQCIFDMDMYVNLPVRTFHGNIETTNKYLMIKFIILLPTCYIYLSVTSLLLTLTIFVIQIWTKTS